MNNQIVRKIGIVYETKEDVPRLGAGDPELSYHWREPEELDAIAGSIETLGFETILIGAPDILLNNLQNYRNHIDFIFNLSVGFVKRFRLALAPALYELAGIPYSGADPYTKTVSQNKVLMKSVWDKMGIPTPIWTEVRSPADVPSLEWEKFPAIVKPAYEGSSVGITANSVVHDMKELSTQLDGMMNRLRMPFIVEEFIAGREIKAGMIGDNHPAFTGLIEDTCEGEPLGDKFLYYDIKTRGSFGKKAVPANSPEYSKILDDCGKIYPTFLPCDYGTFDIRIDTHGRHYFLEFNADATLHPRRTLARCCDLNGVDYVKMIRLILETAFDRQGLRWK